MSQTNTNTNNGQNRNQNSGRGGQGQGATNGSGRSDCRNNRWNKLITKYSSKGKMKDGPISKLTITKSRHRPSQIKKIRDALPVFCGDKNYGGLDEVLCTGRDKVEDDFMPAYPDANRWSSTHQVQIAIVDPNATEGVKAITNEHPVTYNTVEQTNVTDANLQKQLLLVYKRNSKNKSQEYTKFLADKKSVILILFGQRDEATQTKIALRINYTEDRDEGRLLAFIEQLRSICFSNNDGGYMRPINKL